MFDLTTRDSYKNVSRWYKDLTKICQKIPICLVGNKADVKDRKCQARQINFHRKKNLQYYDVSARSNYQFEKPFVWLLKQLTGNKDLTLIESVPVEAPEIQMDQNHINQLKQERQNADMMAKQEFPDTDQNF